MVRRRLSLPFTDVKEDDEVVTDEEINTWKWKSYHEIDVKQNIGNGRYIHKIIQSKYNAKIMPIYFLDNYGGSADQLVIMINLQKTVPLLVVFYSENSPLRVLSLCLSSLLEKTLLLFPANKVLNEIRFSRAC